MPVTASNTVCVRRPGGSGAKERIPLSNMLWDLQNSQPSKSVGAISGMSGTLLGNGSGGSNTLNNHFALNTKSLTLASSGRSAGLGPEAHGNHGLPNPSQVPSHYRYSFGVFDPTPSSKLGKGCVTLIIIILSVLNTLKCEFLNQKLSELLRETASFRP